MLHHHFTTACTFVILILLTSGGSIPGSATEPPVPRTMPANDETLVVTMDATGYGLCAVTKYFVVGGSSSIEGSDSTHPAVYQSRSSYTYNYHPDPGSGSDSDEQTSYAPLGQAEAASSVRYEAYYGRAVSLTAGTAVEATIGVGAAGPGELISIGRTLRLIASAGSFTCSDGISTANEANCTLEASWSPSRSWHDIRLVDHGNRGCSYRQW